MGHLFSRTKRKSTITEQDKAVLQLKSTRDKIHQYQKRSELSLEKDRQMAKKLLLDNKKERAKLLLRRKRFIEEKLRLADGQLTNIEQIIQDIEYAQIEMRVVDGLKIGNEALKQINEMMSIEEIETILDETQEAAEKQREINDLLSGGVLTAEDEADVEAELEKMIENVLEKQLPNVEPTEMKLPEVPEGEVILPDVPTTTPEAKMSTQKPMKVAAT